MKKKLTRRVLSLVLAIVLMMSMAITASAASVSWTEGSYTYVATVTEGSSTSYKYGLLSGTTKSHTGGTTTVFTLTSSNRATVSASTSDFESTFRVKLISALNNTSNLRSARTFYVTNTTTLRYSGSTSGTYGVYARVTGNSASWRVDRNGIETLTYGTLSYAPTTAWTQVILTA